MLNQRGLIVGAGYCCSSIMLDLMVGVLHLRSFPHWLDVDLFLWHIKADAAFFSGQFLFAIVLKIDRL